MSSLSDKEQALKKARNQKHLCYPKTVLFSLKKFSFYYQIFSLFLLTMNGLILSDSLLSGCPLDSINSLRKNHSLDSLDLKCFPGFTMGQLIGGNGEIHSLMQQKLYDQVFVVAGANNFSNDVEDDHVVKCKFIAQEFKDLFHSVCQLYKHTNFSFAPIPFRNLCKEENVIH